MGRPTGSDLRPQEDKGQQDRSGSRMRCFCRLPTDPTPPPMLSLCTLQGCASLGTPLHFSPRPACPVCLQGQQSPWSGVTPSHTCRVSLDGSIKSLPGCLAVSSGLWDRCPVPSLCAGQLLSPCCGPVPYPCHCAHLEDGHTQACSRPAPQRGPGCGAAGGGPRVPHTVF